MKTLKGAFFLWIFFFLVIAGFSFVINSGFQITGNVPLTGILKETPGEEVIFPDDEHGWDGIVRYEREQGEYLNDELYWTKATIHTLNLKWEGDHFTPNIKEFEFGEGE